MPEPIAFVVMPFDRKPTTRTEPHAPAEVDFDAVWERIHAPVLDAAGYRPVRADVDLGAMIITQMIQRLAVADLVVADVTLVNANVYYEIGIRHAARETGCVLVAADWSRPAFDLRSIRQLRYPLADGDVGPVAAEQARSTLGARIATLATGKSPVFDAVPGFPDMVDESRLSAFEDLVAQLTAFNADVGAVRVAPENQRKSRALQVLDTYGARSVVRETVVLQLIRLLRDYVGWQAVLDYIDTLPDHVVRHPLVVEQQCLALGKVGDPATAAARLQALVDAEGPTSERLGLLGGRYKQLYRDQAVTPSERRRYLGRAINAYEQGMLTDLNDYYPASNLPRLYRARGKDGDEQRASDAEVLTMIACRRSITLQVTDEWARPTLLGMAFSRGDIDEVERLRNEIEEEGAARWMLATTLDDLEDSVAQHADGVTKTRLRELLDELRALLPGE